MKIKHRSFFRDELKDRNFFENWVRQLETLNGRTYERYEVPTELGKTHVWGLHTREENPETLVIFPGARTTALFWDFDQGLDHLKHRLNIYLVETNGLPNLSDGTTPDIKSLDYGHWAADVLDKIGIKQAFIAGASFGGLICMKLAIVSPSKIKAVFLLNPGCLQPFSLAFSNLYYNLLPIVRPTEKNVRKFIDKAIFSRPDHQLSPQSEKMLIEYELFALQRYRDNTSKPYYMNRELTLVTSDTYLLLGDKDLLFPFQKSVDNAQKHLATLQDIRIFDNVGHGIETYAGAMHYIGEKINHYRHAMSK